MAFVVRPITNQRPMLQAIAGALRKAFAKSRFCGMHGDVEISTDAKTISFTGIRLRVRKTYCGNHPGPCVALFARKEKKSACLEGADWVEFNDLVNDVLDALAVEARVTSSSCVQRLGRQRRINYDMWDQSRNGLRPHYEWERIGSPGDYQDCIGTEAPRSGFPDGTPGGIDAEREEQRRLRLEARRKQRRLRRRAHPVEEAVPA